MYFAILFDIKIEAKIIKSLHIMIKREEVEKI